MTQVSNLAGDAVTRLLPDLSALSAPEAGGAVRKVADTVLTSFGAVATTTAVQSYETMSSAALEELIQASIAAGERGSARVGLAVALNDALRREFVAKPVRVAKKVAESLEPVVGQTMTKYSQGAFVEAATQLADSVMREMSNIYRDTIKANSLEDPRVSGYQRVASASACAFCLVVCLNEYTSFDADGGYHDHCSCTTVPIFTGMSAVRPDYYDEFQQIYVQGGIDAQSPVAEDIFSAIRSATGRS